MPSGGDISVANQTHLKISGWSISTMLNSSSSSPSRFSLQATWRQNKMQRYEDWTWYPLMQGVISAGAAHLTCNKLLAQEEGAERGFPVFWIFCSTPHHLDVILSFLEEGRCSNRVWRGDFADRVDVGRAGHLTRLYKLALVGGMQYQYCAYVGSTNYQGLHYLPHQLWDRRPCRCRRCIPSS